MREPNSSNSWTIFGSIGAALAAAVCCLGPLLLVSFGVTGAWIGSLSAFEPYRLVFMVVATGFLGIGFYRVYGRSTQQECAEGAECEAPVASRTNQAALWVSAAVVVALFASPYFLTNGLDDASAAQAASTPPQSSVTAADKDSDKTGDDAKSATIALAVEGMTCGGCTSTVQAALMGVDGVERATVTFEPPQAHVVYNPAKITIEDLTASTSAIGYPSKAIGDSDE